MMRSCQAHVLFKALGGVKCEEPATDQTDLCTEHEKLLPIHTDEDGRPLVCYPCLMGWAHQRNGLQLKESSRSATNPCVGVSFPETIRCHCTCQPVCEVQHVA